MEVLQGENYNQETKHLCWPLEGEVEISVTEEVLVTMSAGRDWLSTVASASDKASDTPVPEATEVSTSTCKHREKEVILYKL